MSYVVLARKYRPMRFADMVGQEHIGRTLGNAIRQDRVHHAYLFSGARGLGKTTTARIFAKALVCERGPTPEPCNECAQCTAVTEGRSVDVIEIDGASNNSVENIRGLREQVHYLPQTARRKVYIIDEVHMLTTSAFNALLKTLEEPPAHVNFVFATTEPHKVLPTILSRVSRLDFRRVSVAEIVEHLRAILVRERLGVDDGGLRLIGRAAGGSVRDAMTLLDQVLAFASDAEHVTEAEARAVLGQAEHTAVAELVDALLARDPDAVLRIFDGLTAAGHDLTVLALQMLEDLRDLTVARLCRDRELFLDATADELDELVKRSEAVVPVMLSQTFDRLWRVVDRLPTARSQRLVLEMGLLDISQREPLVPLGDLVERLQALEGGAPAEGGGGAGSAPRAPSRAVPAPASGARGRRASEPLEDAPPWPADVPDPIAPQVELPTRAAASAQVSAPEQARVEVGPLLPAPPIETPSTATVPAALGASAVQDPSIASSEFARYLTQAKMDGTLTSGAELAAEPTKPTAGNGSPRNTPRSGPSNGAPRSGPSNGAPVPINGAAAPIAVAATPEPAPRAEPVRVAVDPDDPFAQWEHLVARVREIDEYASAVLGELGLVELGDSVVRVAAPRGSFAHTELSTSDVRARIEQAALEHRGAPLTLELVDGEPSLPECPSIVLIDRRRREELRAAVELEAQAHPAIAALVRDFDARISATRPLRDP